MMVVIGMFQEPLRQQDITYFRGNLIFVVVMVETGTLQEVVLMMIVPRHHLPLVSGRL